MIDFSKLMASQNSMQVEPRNIFMGLPTRDKRYEYPRDVQTEVWKQWYEIRNNENCIRPLAKLSKAVKVADTGNQGKAESKALSAVTVTLREDTKSFEKTDGVFNKDTFS